MFLAVILFNDSFVTIMSITYTTLILIEFLNVIQALTVIRWAVIVTCLLSLAVYLCSIYFFNTLFKIEAFMDKYFMVKVLLITSASWFPLWVFMKLQQCYDPDIVRKVRRGESMHHE